MDNDKEIMSERKTRNLCIQARKPEETKNGNRIGDVGNQRQPWKPRRAYWRNEVTFDLHSTPAHLRQKVKEKPIVCPS